MTRYWPDDPDGHALRDLESAGFDFGARHCIEFNVDFDAWPPSPVLLEQLRAIYPQAQCMEPNGDESGYVWFAVEARLSYEGVTSIQAAVSAIAEPYGGWCDDWGIAEANSSDDDAS